MMDGYLGTPAGNSVATLPPPNNVANTATPAAAAPASGDPREAQIRSAVSFLTHPRVVGTPASKRVSFLEKKGLSTAEIAEALKRVNPNAEETKLVAAAALEGKSASAAVEHLAPPAASTTPTTTASVSNTAAIPSTSVGTAVPGVSVPYTTTTAAPATQATSQPSPQLPPGFSFYPLPGMIPIGNNLYAYPQAWQQMQQAAQATQSVQKPSQTTGSNWAAYFTGAGAALTVALGASYLAKRFFNPTSTSHSLSLPSQSQPQSQPQYQAQPQPQLQASQPQAQLSQPNSFTSTVQDNKLDDRRQRTELERFAAPSFNDVSNDAILDANSRQSRNKTGSDDVSKMIDALTIRVGDLDDRLNGQVKMTQRMITNLQSSVEDLNKNVNDRDLKKHFSQLQDDLLDKISNKNKNNNRSSKKHKRNKSESSSSSSSSTSSSSPSPRDRRGRRTKNRSRSRSRSRSRTPDPSKQKPSQDHDNQAAAFWTSQSARTNENQSQLQPVPPVSSVNNNTNDTTDEVSVAEVPAESKSFKPEQAHTAVDAALNKLLQVQNGSSQETQKITNLIKLYISNLVTHPDKDIFRRIQCSNQQYQQKISRNQDALDLLLALGFEHKGQFLEWGKSQDQAEDKLRLEFLKASILKFDQNKIDATASPNTTNTIASSSSSLSSSSAVPVGDHNSVLTAASASVSTTNGETNISNTNNNNNNNDNNNVNTTNHDTQAEQQ